MNNSKLMLKEGRGSTTRGRVWDCWEITNLKIEYALGKIQLFEIYF